MSPRMLDSSQQKVNSLRRPNSSVNCTESRRPLGLGSVLQSRDTWSPLEDCSPGGETSHDEDCVGEGHRRSLACRNLEGTLSKQRLGKEG